MTKVVFETATIADVIKRADYVAPKKGAAYDTAAGIVIEVNPGGPMPVIVRSTDVITFFMEWVDVVEASGPPATWRIPSAKLTTLLTGLPIGSGKTVTFNEVTREFGRNLEVKSGNIKAKFNIMLMEHYPKWDAFDPDDLQVVNDLGARIRLVDWATDKTLTPFNTVYFTGEHLIATDKLQMARCEFKIDLPEGVGGPGDPTDLLVQASMLSGLVPKSGEIRIGMNDNQLLVMPNDTCQIRALRTDAKYPDLTPILISEREHYVEFRKEEFLDIARRVTAFAGNDRAPMLKILIVKGRMTIYLISDDQSAIMDQIDIGPNQGDHKKIELLIEPRFIIDAIDKAPSERVKIGYNTSKASRILYIDGGAGYESWIAQRTNQ